MSLAKKLNLNSGKTLRVSGKPASVDLGDVKPSANSDAELLFAKTLADVDAKAGAVVAAAKADRIAWIAYPKAGQLGTDLNRDILWKHLLKSGIQGVRQIALDDVWSAMRFRPKPGSAKPASKKAGGINARWHEAHRLGTGSSLDERIAWHVAHAKACACRPMPASILAAIDAGTKKKRSSKSSRAR